MSLMPAITVAYPDPAMWDQFCDAHEHGHLLQHSQWGMLKRHTGWDDIRIGVYDDGELRAGAQVLTQRRYGLAMCYVPRGPLLCDDTLINQALVAAITQYAKRQRAVVVRYEPNVVSDSAHASSYTRALVIANAQTSLSKTTTHHLDAARRRRRPVTQTHDQRPPRRHQTCSTRGCQCTHRAH